MHSAADQIRVRPESAWSTPCSVPLSTTALRCRRSPNVGDSSAATPKVNAPSRKMPARRFQPSRRQPVHSSTSPYVSQDAREPASMIAMPTATAASNQPTRPKLREAASSANGDRLASTMPSLRLHGPSTPLRRSAAATSSAVHMPRPLIACLPWSISQNSGLVPITASANASSVQMPTMIASPLKVRRLPSSLATADATTQRNGR